MHVLFFKGDIVLLSMTFDVQILTTHGLRGVWETNESFEVGQNRVPSEMIF